MYARLVDNGHDLSTDFNTRDKGLSSFPAVKGTVL